MILSTLQYSLAVLRLPFQSKQTQLGQNGNIWPPPPPPQVTYIHCSVILGVFFKILAGDITSHHQDLLMFYLPLQPTKKSHKKIKDLLDSCYQHLDNQGFSSTMYDAHVCITFDWLHYLHQRTERRSQWGYIIKFGQELSSGLSVAISAIKRAESMRDFPLSFYSFLSFFSLAQKPPRNNGLLTRRSNYVLLKISYPTHA